MDIFGSGFAASQRFWLFYKCVSHLCEQCVVIKWMLVLIIFLEVKKLINHIYPHPFNLYSHKEFRLF